MIAEFESLYGLRVEAVIPAGPQQQV